MKSLSTIALAVGPSATLEIDALYKQMKADGIDVVGFGAGEPDFATPDHIKQAGIYAIENNITRYTPSVGTIDLRKAVCKRLKEDYGLEYTHTQIVVSNGAKPCIYTALQAMLNPGDEVILPAPYWVSYIELIRLAGGVPVVVHASEAEDFKISAEKLAAAVTDKTKCMILNNPSNPTGMMYSREELTAIAKVCVEKDLYIIADEIYGCLVYDNKEFVSIASLGEDIKERTILINGVSKAYAMTGWRIGYAATTPTIAKVMSNYLAHSTSSPCAISQHAAQTAFNASQESVQTMRRAFERRRNLMVKLMNQIEDVSCIMPEGAFYVMMNIEKLIGKTLYGTVIENADVFCKLFLEHGKVAVVPGTSFEAHNFVRWSYAASTENIRKGLERLKKFLAAAPS